ncbi:unnamed protein product, partial [marine sediment metagenome]
MTPAEIETIKQRADAATPGPWGAGMILDRADVEFMNHAREDMDTLLEEIETLREIAVDCILLGRHTEPGDVALKEKHNVELTILRD